ncbi:MAG: DNA-processing protein DprA [Steroidobacteraceae bacterium]
MRVELTRTCVLLARAGVNVEHLRAAAAASGSSPEALLAEGARALRGIELRPSTRDALTSPDERAIDADLRWLEAAHATLVPFSSPQYPELLAQAGSAPAVLYVLGDPAALKEPQLAMVGSRNPTPAGRETARDFARHFARIGLAITSGLALGIDGASHEGALAGGGLTIAVCGHGLDIVYPHEHRELAARIREHGALVSEFPPGTQPLRPNFPQRNRIISWLSFGTLVVEAGIRSGSLNTARYALDQGREVFAIPGSIHNPVARGCHKLIREGAKLVEEAADVLSELKIPLLSQRPAPPRDAPSATSAASLAMDKDYEILLDAVGFEPVSIDAIVERTGLPSESIASMLLILELDGRVAPSSGGRYCRLPEQTP